ncbi:MAG: shikimate dehydrogenase [Actinomycetaceae bacterium]|nr:shikimate dehydrogenase [Actinomycetaceae bacterium]MDY6143671.1 shikimate dehydrogenase [Arcanobacterium sp.]
MTKYTDVVGHPIEHSMSPILMGAAHVGVVCNRHDLLPGELASYVASRGSEYAGLSVTMPFKHEAFTVCDMVDGLAQNVGSINTLVFQPTGSSRMVIGFNTDVAGIVNAVREVNGSERGYTKAVILGSGATASSALAALVQLKAEDITVCARTLAGPRNATTAAHRMNIDIHTAPLNKIDMALRGADLVISTLPAHAADPWIDALDSIDFGAVTLLDVVYDPDPSDLVERVRTDGGVIVPGWLMLLHQGIMQAQLFSGKAPNAQAMRKALIAEVERRTA